MGHSSTPPRGPNSSARGQACRHGGSNCGRQCCRQGTAKVLGIKHEHLAHLVLTNHMQPALSSSTWFLVYTSPSPDATSDETMRVYISMRQDMASLPSR
mmetsp:Transcript_39722/g.127296  ORF Transcript_39722/g.127296 Transcript_39722/m.127296 type:complete len:99 (-) Transcript_39722:1238-1534(-)